MAVFNNVSKFGLIYMDARRYPYLCGRYHWCCCHPGQNRVSHPLRPDVNTVDVTEFYDSKKDNGKAFGRSMVISGSPMQTGLPAVQELHQNWRFCTITRKSKCISHISTTARWEPPFVHNWSIKKKSAPMTDLSHRLKVWLI
nr:hypothetical protein [Desulfobacula sp.]